MQPCIKSVTEESGHVMMAFIFFTSLISLNGPFNSKDFLGIRESYENLNYL